MAEELEEDAFLATSLHKEPIIKLYLRRISLNVRAKSAKIIYYKTTHSSVTS